MLWGCSQRWTTSSSPTAFVKCFHRISVTDGGTRRLAPTRQLKKKPAGMAVGRAGLRTGPNRELRRQRADPAAALRQPIVIADEAGLFDQVDMADLIAGEDQGFENALFGATIKVP